MNTSEKCKSLSGVNGIWTLYSLTFHQSVTEVITVEDTVCALKGLKEQAGDVVILPGGKERKKKTTHQLARLISSLISIGPRFG